MRKFFIFFLAFAGSAYAHCPLHFQPENVCVMYDQNMIYFYPHGKSHDGPYVDLKAFGIDSVVSEGKTIKVARAARGIYKIDGTAAKSISVNFVKNQTKEKQTLTVKSE